MAREEINHYKTVIKLTLRGGDRTKGLVLRPLFKALMRRMDRNANSS